MNEAKHIINISETGLTFLSWIHVLICFMWGVSQCVSGFCSGFFHGTPIAFEIFLLAFLFSLTRFEIDWDKSLKTKRRQLTLALVILVLAFTFNIVHVIFSAIEMSDCTSNLCVNSFWVLAVFIAILSVLICLEVIEFVFIVRYYQNAGVLEKIKK